MRWRAAFSLWGICFALAFAGGCSSSAPPPPETPVAKTPKPAPPPTAEEIPAPAPVAAPETLFVVGRLKSPKQFSDLVSEWVNVPVPIQAVVQREVPALQKVLRLDAPVDLAMSLDPESFSEPKVLFAASVGLTDYRAALDELRAAGHPVERISNGMQLVRLGEPCIVARANGPSPARLICADSRKDLDVLAPYMAATMPTEDLGPDELFVEVRAKPVRDRFGKKAGWLKVGIPVFLREVATGNARLDAAVADATRATVNELLAVIPDLDKLMVRARATEGRQALELSVGLTYAGQKSWSAQTLALRAADSGPAPALFWKLPADVERASFTAGNSHPERLEPLLSGLTELMAGAAEHFELDSKRLDVFLKQLSALNRKEPYVLAEGPPVDPNAVGNGGMLDLLAQRGYTVVGMPADGGETVAFYDALTDLFNDPVWRKALVKRTKEDWINRLPKIQKDKPPARYGLPKSTTRFRFRLPKELVEELQEGLSQRMGKEPPEAQPVTISLLLSQTDSEIWMAMSSDEELAAKKLAAVVSGTGETLAKDAALASFRTQSVVGGGYATMSSVVGFLAPYAAAASREPLTRQQFVLAMPHAGKTPILTSISVDATGPQLWYRVVLPRAAMEDLAAGVVAAAANLGGAF